MRVSWWQGGLHLEPRTEPEREALRHLEKALASFGLGADTAPEREAVRPGDLPPGRYHCIISDFDNDQAVVPVDKSSEAL